MNGRYVAYKLDKVICDWLSSVVQFDQQELNSKAFRTYWKFVYKTYWKSVYKTYWKSVYKIRKKKLMLWKSFLHEKGHVEKCNVILWELCVDCKYLRSHAGKLCIQVLLVWETLYYVTWFIQDQRSVSHCSLSDVRTLYIMCIVVYLVTSWADLTILFVIFCSVMFFPLHF
jgi:hypothetical protein